MGIGCGSGQLAFLLSPYFRKVINIILFFDLVKLLKLTYRSSLTATYMCQLVFFLRMSRS